MKMTTAVNVILMCMYSDDGTESDLSTFSFIDNPIKNYLIPKSSDLCFKQ